MNDFNYILKYKKTLCQKLFHSMKHFILLCQLFCTAPINIKFKNNELIRSPSTNINCFKFLLHYIWCFTVLCCILTSTYFQHLEFDKEMSFITRILYLGEYVFSIFNSVFILIGCHYQRTCFKKYFLNIIDIDMKLLKCGEKTSYIFIRKLLIKFIVVYIIFFGCVIIIDLFYNRIDAKSFFRSSTVYVIPNIISMLSLTQYFGLLFAIKERYKKVNDILKKLTTMDMDFDIDAVGNLTEKCNKQMLTIFLSLEMQKGFAQRISTSSKFNVNNNNYGRGNKTLENILNSLRKIYADLNCFNKNVTSSFGALVISTIISTFLILSIQFYAFYKIFEGFNTQDLSLTFYTTFWIILHGGKVILILLFNYKIIKEVRIIRI